MAATVDVIKSLLSPRVYDSLTGGGAAGDAGCASAIEHARAYVAAFLSRYKKTFDETHSSISRAVELMTLYELYSRKENESVAADKKAQAEELLASSFGAGASGGGASGASPASGTAYRMPIASVMPRKSIAQKIRSRADEGLHA